MGSPGLEDSLRVVEEVSVILDLNPTEFATIRAALMFWRRACKVSRVSPASVPFIYEAFPGGDPQPLESALALAALQTKIEAPPTDADKLLSLTEGAAYVGMSAQALSGRLKKAGFKPVRIHKCRKLFRTGDIRQVSRS